MFAIKSIQEIVERFGAYLQIDYWEKGSKVIKFSGVYYVLLNSSETDGQHADYLITILEI
ncbi:hypothetical protein [Lysinibacillus sp. NPDC047702]|uniref:hypothetical protein n=1 Tax=unclassified Lysinibacillus TaxID=2636778 RepID=UPI003D0504BC